MSQSILALNAGSSSVKFALYDLGSPDGQLLVSRGTLDLGDAPRLTARAADGTVQCDRQFTADAPDGAGIAEILRLVKGELGGRKLICIGHRIVHGGNKFSKPVRLTPATIEKSILNSLVKFIVAVAAYASPMDENYIQHLLFSLGAFLSSWSDNRM